MTEPIVLTIPEAARLLKVSNDTVWRWCYSRKISSLKVGNSRRVKVSELQRFMDENTIPAKK